MSNIKQFSNKVVLASNRGSKELLLPISEATSILNSIIAIQNENIELKNEIIRLQKQLLEPTIIALDGGDF